MKNFFLSNEMLREIFNALEKGETFNYSDENTTMKINPSGISIQYKSSSKSSREKEVEEFLAYCDKLDDELFVEACETFEPGEILRLQEQLDTEDYKETIQIFTTRIKEVANKKMNDLIENANLRLKHQEETIEKAYATIEKIHEELELASKKYSV